MRTIGAVLLMIGLGVSIFGCKNRRNPPEPDNQDTDPIGKVTPNPVNSIPKSGHHKWGTFTVGPRTTVVTGPVGADGYIDYTAALNERLAKGITTENNVNVALWRFLGPNPRGEEKVPAVFFEKLGIQPPPAMGDYFVGLKQFAESQGVNPTAAFEAMGKLSQQPWTANEDATLSGWLTANHKHLTALREATQKTQYYSPIIPDSAVKGLSNTFSPGSAAYRELAGALASRAMLHLGNNQPVEAWQDLLACHRLGRLVGRGGTLIDGMFCIAIEQLACRGDIVFLDRVKPNAKLIETCLRDLKTLPPLPNLAEQLAVGERFWFLDNLMQISRQGVTQVPLVGAGFKPIQHGMTDELIEGIDWNPALEFANEGFDRLTATFREKDRHTRIQKFSVIEDELRPRYDQLVGGRASEVLKNARLVSQRGQIFGEMLFATAISNLRKVLDVADRAFQTHENVTVAFALAWYQRVNGSYPERLADLSPTYLAQLPIDVFTGKALTYQPKTTGFVLYSLGINGRDDGGRGYADQPAGDDLVVRIPLLPK